MKKPKSIKQAGWVHMGIKVPEEDRAAWHQAAEKDDRSLASWVRSTLNEAAKRQTSKGNG
ncbi:MAG: hypothetical protein F4X93_04465 [Proteobacteria bacterium]|nr:hypothetical protein [Pseudomonadota bacterium]